VRLLLDSHAFLTVIAQAHESMTLVSRDPSLKAYGIAML